MIVKPSALLETVYLKQIMATPVGQTLSIEDIDTPLSWPLNPEFLDDVNFLDIPVAFSDGTDVIRPGEVSAVTTNFDGTRNPAIVIYTTPTTPLHKLNAILIHEYRHAMQMLEGRLYFDGTDLYWLGVKTPLLQPIVERDHYKEAMAAIDKLRYMAQPWEFEADHMVRHYILPGTVFQRIVDRYGTTWPVHWSPKYVAKRFYALKDWRAVIEELYNDGF